VLETTFRVSGTSARLQQVSTSALDHLESDGWAFALRLPRVDQARREEAGSMAP
jgi:hypothetical protein